MSLAINLTFALGVVSIYTMKKTNFKWICSFCDKLNKGYMTVILNVPQNYSVIRKCPKCKERTKISFYTTKNMIFTKDDT